MFLLGLLAILLAGFSSFYFNSTTFLYTGLLSIIAMLSGLFLKKYRLLFYRISGILCLLTLFILIHHRAHLIFHEDKTIVFSKNQDVPFLFEVMDVHEGTSVQKLFVSILHIESDSIHLGRKALVIISDCEDVEFKVGQKWWLKSRPRLIKKGKIPSTFNRKDYYARKGLYVEFRERGLASMMKIESSSRAANLPQHWREVLKRKLENNIRNDESRQILLAMLLGDKDNLEEEVREVFTASGVMHIMAISGLHVGIIYLLLSYLLRFLSGRGWKCLELILILSSIWIYAFLAGMSASVTRASFMFSLIGIGGVLKRKASIYNSIACSAFFLLYIASESLFDIGFLLSYTAVLGIVSMYPIFNLFSPTSNILFQKVCSSLWVSLSAQLSVLPIVLLVFKRFPVYFLISNLLAIPLTFVVVALGFTTLILSLPFEGSFVVKLLFLCLEFTTLLLQFILDQISSLPHSLISLDISIEFAVLFIISLLSTIIGIYAGKRRWLLISYFLISTSVFVEIVGNGDGKDLAYLISSRNRIYYGHAMWDKHYVIPLNREAKNSEHPVETLRSFSERLSLPEPRFIQCTNPETASSSFILKVRNRTIWLLSSTNVPKDSAWNSGPDLIIVEKTFEKEFLQKILHKTNCNVILSNLSMTEKRECSEFITNSGGRIMYLDYYDYAEIPTSL